MASSELSVMLTAKGNLENELKQARDRVKDLSSEIRKIQSTGGTVGDTLADEFRQATVAADKLNRKVNDTNRDIKRMTTESKQASASMGGLGKAMGKVAAAAAAYVSIQTAADFMKESILQGSALQESLSKTGVVFGRSADQIEAWSQTSSTAFGLSQQSALEAVSTYGNLFQAFGVGQDKAAEMSQALVGLAADLASFNNTSVDEAVQALRSGLSGETEPLKRYGIAINDARLKAEALRLGLLDSTGALDTAGKAQAVYALILKDSTLAQGDFARTSDGFANTMKVLGAEAGNAQAEIGVELVSAIEKAAEAFGGSEGLAAMIRDTGSATADFVAGIGGAVESLGLLVNAIDDVVAVGDTGLVDFLLTVDKVVNPVQRLIGQTMDYGSELRAQEKALDDSTRAAEDLYAGYIATWDASDKAASGIEDVGDEARDAAGKVAGLNRAMSRLTRVVDRQQALKAWRTSLRESIAKPSGDTAREAVEAFDAAFRSFKDGSKGQAAFVANNYDEMKRTIRQSGLSQTAQEQLLGPLAAAKAEADKVLASLQALDGTTVSATVLVQNKLATPGMDPGRFATGGAVVGPGTATSDSIPAFLSNGEYVLRAKTVSQLGVATLDKLNRYGELPATAVLAQPGTTALVNQMTVNVSNPAETVDVEKGVMRALARAKRIEKERA